MDSSYSIKIWRHIWVCESYMPFSCLPVVWVLHIYQLLAYSSSSCLCSYLPPEYLSHGIVDEKTDVFAFGVVLLELVTGRRALDYSQQSLVLWVSSWVLALCNKVAKLILFNHLNGWAPINSDFFYLHQAKPLLKKNNVRELVDPFTINYNSRQMNLVLLAASLCIQQSSIRRPCMSQACCCLYYSQINYTLLIYLTTN